MAKYLDPKADLTFKKIFGEHPDLAMSLLNALLPFSEAQKITEIEYLPAELTPDNPMRKNSIVDVRCKATDGRQFIVEMQMEWTTAFKQRFSWSCLSSSPTPSAKKRCRCFGSVS